MSYENIMKGERDMLQDKAKAKSILQFMVVLLFVSFALFITYYGQQVMRYNTTILAFNYSYGFISRGLLGTLYLGLSEILPFDILNYESVVNITLIATTVIVFVFFLLAICILVKSNKNYQTNIQYVILFFAMYFIPMFYSMRNMGRPDVYMMFFTFIGLLLIIYQKFEWLLIPLAILSTMVHQGYVFMFYNIFMYLLIYKSFKSTGKQRKKYSLILGISFISVSILFLYFNFFSHFNGEEIYDEIVALASMLGQNGEVFDILVNHEILGIDPWEEEWSKHIYNFIELPIYCLFMLPYIILGVRLFKNIIHAAETKIDRILYTLLPLCSLTMFPSYILKIDYGRWLFAGIAYFSLVVLALCALNDKLVTEQLHKLMEDIKSRYAYSSLLLVYIATTIPLHDIHINEILRSISEWLDAYWLHILS